MGVLLFAATVLLAAFILRSIRGFRLPPLPPGPRRFPVIGNLFQYPQSRPWAIFQQWSKQYGSEVIYVDLAGTSLVLLNSYRAAWELFERQGAHYSSRASLPMITDLMGWDDSISFMPYGSIWREHRKIAHRGFNEQASLTYRPYLVKASHSLLLRLLKDPEHFNEHLRLMVAQVTLPATYGIEVERTADPHIALPHKVVETLNYVGNPTKYLVNLFPFMKYIPSWIPGAQFKRDAARWRQEKEETMEMMISDAERLIHSGSAKPSLVSTALSDLSPGSDEYKEMRTLLRGLASAVFVASMDTTASFLEVFFLAMVLHPDAQRKAHEEIDRILGHGSLPSFENERALPYVSALMKECARWHVVTPFGVPHYNETEQVYDGMRIPAKSLVICNAWAVAHDEEEYPDSAAFKPERFLKDDKISEDVRDPFSCLFGLGRRICPGRFHATANLWIVIASILAVFEISCDVDDQGKPIWPAEEFLPNFISPPKAFKCRITPRSKKAEEVILGLGEDRDL